MSLTWSEMPKTDLLTSRPELTLYIWKEGPNQPLEDVQTDLGLHCHAQRIVFLHNSSNVEG